MSDSVLMGILAVPIAIAALESGLVRRNDPMSDKPTDEPTENQNLDRWVDRWGAIILWVLGGLGAVALVFFVWFLLVLGAASR